MGKCAAPVAGSPGPLGASPALPAASSPHLTLALLRIHSSRMGRSRNGRLSLSSLSSTTWSAPWAFEGTDPFFAPNLQPLLPSRLELRSAHNPSSACRCRFICGRLEMHQRCSGSAENFIATSAVRVDLLIILGSLSAMGVSVLVQHSQVADYTCSSSQHGRANVWRCGGVRRLDNRQTSKPDHTIFYGQNFTGRIGGQFSMILNDP
jgi:hypothetical protein